MEEIKQKFPKMKDQKLNLAAKNPQVEDRNIKTKLRFMV